MTGRLAGGVAVAAALVVAMSIGAQAASGPALAGPTWQLTRLAGIDRHAADVTAQFASGETLSGFSGCNSYSGTYKASGNTIRVSKQLAVTQKACRPAVMAQEKAYLAALLGARTYSVAQGTLTLKGATGHALATFRAQSQALAGTAWHVISYNNGKQAVESVMASTKLTAIFDRETVSGFAGCNDYTGKVKATPPKITIGPVAAT